MAHGPAIHVTRETPSQVQGRVLAPRHSVRIGIRTTLLHSLNKLAISENKEKK